MTCDHQGGVRADVVVHAFVEDVTDLSQATEARDPTSWRADVELTCSGCGQPYRWLGAGVSPDGLELRAPIAPPGVLLAPAAVAWP